MTETENKGEIAVVDNPTTPTTIANQFDIVDVDAAEAFMNNYQELVKRLLSDDDYQKIGEKNAKKKSAWRKLATAFNISDKIVDEKIERDETNQIISAKYYVEATLPNGRSATGVGVCSIYDKIRYTGDKKEKTQPSNFILRGRFSNAEHDVPSTAHTRAKSRAISDLIGSGEVSAEEMNGNKPKKTKKRVKKTSVKDRSSKSKDDTIPAKAEVVEPQPKKEEKEGELVQDRPAHPKTSSKNIKDLVGENDSIKKAVDNLQSNNTPVTRENIVAELLEMADMGVISLEDYQECKKELIE